MSKCFTQKQATTHNWLTTFLVWLQICNLIWHETANTAVQHAACFASAKWMPCYLALITPVEVPLSKNIWHWSPLVELWAVITGCTGIKCSLQCCWRKVSPLTALADGTALIWLVLRVHTLCLRAGCHRAQHLPAWLTSALLTRRHLDSREEIVINTPLNSSHTDTHTQRQQRVFSS